jgi:hypothetical protein
MGFIAFSFRKKMGKMVYASLVPLGLYNVNTCARKADEFSKSESKSNHLPLPSGERTARRGAALLRHAGTK